MGVKRLSIGERLKKAKKIDTKIEIQGVWSKDWESDQKATLKQLEQALSDDDYDTMCRAVGSLKAITEKRFKGFETLNKNLKKSLEDENR